MTLNDLKLEVENAIRVAGGDSEVDIVVHGNLFQVTSLISFAGSRKASIVAGDNTFHRPNLEVIGK